MPTYIHDPFTSGELDSSKWQVLQLPIGDGSFWSYGDPDARVRANQGTLEITVNPFRLQHDVVHMFDDPKHLIVTPQPIPVAASGITTIACDMACENFNGNTDDLLDGFAGLIIGDYATGMIFDFVITGSRIGVIYERLPIPGVTPDGGAWTYIVQSPFQVQNEPSVFHHYEIRIDRAQRTCEWTVDGKRIFFTTGIPVDVQSVTPGVGLFTLKAPVPGTGSVSNHGQGATGWWKNLNVVTE